MRAFLLGIVTYATLFCTEVFATDLTAASWNLGWHMDRALLTQWIDACSQTFKKNAQGVYVPDPTGDKLGWDIDSRDDPIEWDYNTFPVCSVYQANFNPVPVTVASYEKRLSQLNEFFEQHLAGVDIIAFQEVTSEQAVREALPSAGADYTICTFAGYKAQRIAIAWRTSLGTQERCGPEDALSLPGSADADRPRPGLTLDLRIDGELVRIMAVHLKSSCVSPQQATGDLVGGGKHCPILQRQVVPFEAWVDANTQDTNKIILLGDFNRDFWHEQIDGAQTLPVRTDDSQPAETLPSGVLVRNLFREAFDGEPAESSFTILHEECPVSTIASDLCALGKTRPLTTAERNQLSAPANLGCRNPLGLDHIMIGSGFRANGPAQHISVGVFGGTRPADAIHPDPLLAISDHCPLIAKLTM